MRPTQIWQQCWTTALHQDWHLGVISQSQHLKNKREFLPSLSNQSKPFKPTVGHLQRNALLPFRFSLNCSVQKDFQTPLSLLSTTNWVKILEIFIYWKEAYYLSRKMKLGVTLCNNILNQLLLPCFCCPSPSVKTDGGEGVPSVLLGNFFMLLFFLSITTHFMAMKSGKMPLRHENTAAGAS